VFVTVKLFSFTRVMLPFFIFSSFYFGIHTSEAKIRWLEVLITCNLSVEIFSVFISDSLVVGLEYNFSLLDWG
jgi:hypothetical protein